MRRMGFEARFQARRALLPAACAAIALALAGCGDSNTVTGERAEIKEPDATVQLSMDEYSFKPATGRSKEGGLVSIVAKNTGSEYHALRVVIPGQEAPGTSAAEQTAEEEIGEIIPGDTETLNLTVKPGSYTWYCPLSNHRRLGMRGKLVVE